MPSRAGRGRRAAVDNVVLGGADFFFVSFFSIFFFSERTWPAASMRPPCLMYLSTSTGVRTGCHYLISLSFGLSVGVCVTFVVFTDCKSCTRPTCTNPGSMEAGEYGQTRGTCFVARRVQGSRSPGCCGFGGVFWVGRICSCFFLDFVFIRTHTACCMMRRPCLIYLRTTTYCS